MKRAANRALIIGQAKLDEDPPVLAANGCKSLLLTHAIVAGLLHLCLRTEAENCLLNFSQRADTCCGEHRLCDHLDFQVGGHFEAIDRCKLAAYTLPKITRRL